MQAARQGFPRPDKEEALLLLKPRFDSPDLEYKTGSIRYLETLGPVAGAFENEPAHINLFCEAFPTAHSIFVDSKHSGRPVAQHSTACS